MKYLLISVGTRGDIEPFLAVAAMLQKRGHEVHCAFPAQLEYLMSGMEVQFHALSEKFLALLDSPDGRMIMGGKVSGIFRIGTMLRLYKEGVGVNKIIVDEQATIIERIKPDKIIYNGKASYPVAWSANHPNKSILLVPIPCMIHFVKNHAHVGFPINLGPINKLSYTLVNAGFIHSVYTAIKDRPEFNHLKKRDIKKRLFAEEIIYTISATLFPRPRYWPENANVLGYHERDKKTGWQPTSDILSFIERHKKFILVSFGSMVNAEPRQKTEIILACLRILKIPTIINTAGGGLVEPPDYDKENILFINRIPYDYIFPKAYGVVHHGGSGTTHMAIKYGCASLILPHIIDQFLWNEIVANLGAGPKGKDVKKINQKNLLPLLQAMYVDQNYKTRALELSTQMQAEDYEVEFIEALES